MVPMILSNFFLDGMAKPSANHSQQYTRSMECCKVLYYHELGNLHVNRYCFWAPLLVVYKQFTYEQISLKSIEQKGQETSI